MNTAIQKLLDAVSNGVNTVDAQLKDGFQTTDLFALIPVASMVPGVISDKAAIVSAWEARTEADLNEWVTYAKTKIDLHDDNTEKKVEAVLGFIIAGVIVFDTFKSSVSGE